MGGSNELSLNYVLLITIVLRKLLTPITLEIAYIHNGTVISILQFQQISLIFRVLAFSQEGKKKV